MIAGKIETDTGDEKTMNAIEKCRFCGTPLADSFADLGSSPLANSYLEPGQLGSPEPVYPLHVYVCRECLLVQLPVCESAEKIFSDYAYFSSFSDSWLNHAREYARMIAGRLALGSDSSVIEIASNDGYLLKNFEEMGIPTLGIEPAANVAKTALEAGIPTLIKFFGVRTARELTAEGRRADLLIGNNVLAHVPDINDFIAGMKIVLKTHGVITMEFPHLMRLMEQTQFDTIYHEHFSYFSFLTVEKMFAKHGLTLFDVEEIPTHGGSLRIYARHSEDDSVAVGSRVDELRQREEKAGFRSIQHYLSFSEKIKETKRDILNFLINAKREGKSIAGYGAPAKGNTLLNYCGIRSDFIDYVVDRSPHKQGRYLPGVRIPIYNPEKVEETRPDYLVILPWNLKEEIMKQMSHIGSWGGRFVVFIPNVKVY